MSSKPELNTKEKDETKIIERQVSKTLQELSIIKEESLATTNTEALQDNINNLANNEKPVHKGTTGVEYSSSSSSSSSSSDDERKPSKPKPVLEENEKTVEKTESPPIKKVNPKKSYPKREHTRRKKQPGEELTYDRK